MIATRLAPPTPLSELLLDGITPVAAYQALRRLVDGPSFLLESAPGAGQLARFSVIGIGKVAEFRASCEGTSTAGPDGLSVKGHGDVIAAARRFVADCRAAYPDAAMSPYAGAYGVASFGCAAFLEPRLATVYPDASLHLVVPQAVVVFDHAAHVADLIVLDAREGLHERIVTALRSAHIAPVERSFRGQLAQSCTSPQRFYDMVAHAREAIHDGELFQIVLSQTWQTALSCDPFDAYRRLRSINPSPYMFCLEIDGATVFGSSPEMLCKLDGRRIRLRPLAGTRARPQRQDDERKVESELRADPKERAEHVMLVDLGRNDVGRVSSYGSVEVSDLMEIERYSHVMHLVSEVQGTIAPDRDAFDLFAAAFPAGTVSGAPKVRALELIAQLEDRSRGVYGGSIARFGFDGSLDACIVLRSAEVREGLATFSAGAGIVADSVPESEDRECRAKATAVARALGAELS